MKYLLIILLAAVVYAFLSQPAPRDNPYVCLDGIRFYVDEQDASLRNYPWECKA